MSITYTEKFADKVDERFTPSSVSHYITNNDYDFVGAKTIKITSISTVANDNYDRDGGYGTAKKLENTIQELTMLKDRSFNILLDKMDEEETKIKAGEVLARQMREVVIPELEAYRFGVMLEAAKDTAITHTAKKAYEEFLDAQEKLNDEDVPANRIAYVTPAFLTELKKDENFVKASDLGQKIAIDGLVGMVDGVPIVRVTKKWMKDQSSGDYLCLIGHKSATVAPVKLAEYRVVTDSERYSGTLFLGRFYYDCFVLNNKKKALVAIKSE